MTTPKKVFSSAILIAGAAVLIAFLGWYFRGEKLDRGRALTRNGGAVSRSAYAGSSSCRDCHAGIYDQWAGSHHAWAERPVDLTGEHSPFEPSRTIRHGTQTSRARMDGGHPVLVTRGAAVRPAPHRVERVIGVDPLYQFLVPAPGGRYQVTELAFDPGRAEWFDIFGEEDRRPGEWGHWSGRGMNWNSMCAACHNTGLKKTYEEPTDSYRTTLAEMGVGCEACHGPRTAHADEQRRRGQHRAPDPMRERLSRDQVQENCGACHARRSELTGLALPGDHFLDHYAPAIPDETDIYYADGQVQEEDYEYIAFLGSRMHAAGVRCIDCHEPHTGKLRAAGDALCLACHQQSFPSGSSHVIPGPEIDPGRHSRHPAGTPGSACVDCHMPLTVFMQRHARRDHGFTIPDPQLSREHGVPNACNRCHTDRTVDWAITTMQQWYPEITQRPARARARWIARARAGQRAAVKPLLRMSREDDISLWRATAVGLLRRWAEETQVADTLLQAARDPDPLVRAMAARSLGTIPPARNREVDTALGELLTDPVRLVRVDAAWARHGTIDQDSRAGRDLLSFLRRNADQPAGALQLGTYHLDRSNPERARFYLDRAVAWDPHSGAVRHAVGVRLNLMGKQPEAVKELREACRLEPKHPGYKYDLALLLGELGHLEETVDMLTAAVRLDPGFARAWYNLGLAQSSAGHPQQALQALVRAESLSAASADIPYARATILYRLGRHEEAAAAARRTLALEPAHAGAASLLRALR